MGRVSKLVRRGLLLVVVVAVVWICLGAVLAFEAQPRALPGESPSPEEIHRLKNALQRQDPRRLADGEIGTLSLSEGELGAGFSQAMEVLGLGRTVAVELESERLGLRASIELPTRFERRFLNIDLRARETDGLPSCEYLRLGRTRVPALLVNLGWRTVANAWLARLGSPGALDMVQAVNLDADRIEVTYRWQPWTVERLQAGLIGDSDKARLRAYSERLASVPVEPGKGRVPLTELLDPMFELAATRSRDGEAVAENRAAILVLGIYVDGRRLEALLPEAADWRPRPRRREVTLHRQHDLARHFMTSALLTSLGGSGLSNALGLYKELEDGRAGSGFSFQDLAADRAGTRFAELATGSERSAEKCQSLLSEPTADDELLPRVDDLPEGLSQGEFERLVGEVGSVEYERLIGEIERRLDASPLYSSG